MNITPELIDEFEKENGKPVFVKYDHKFGLYISTNRKSDNVNRLKDMQQFGLEVWLKQREKIVALREEKDKRIETLKDALCEMHQVLYDNPAMDDLYEKVMADSCEMKLEAINGG